MNKPTISECGTFAYHPIPLSLDILINLVGSCVIADNRKGTLEGVYSDDDYAGLNAGVFIDFGDGLCEGAEERGLLVVLPLHMPTPWEMAALAKQGVDTGILTAEQIMALRVLGYSWLYEHDLCAYASRSPKKIEPKEFPQHMDFSPYAWVALPTPTYFKGDWTKSLVSLGGWDGDTYTPCGLERGAE